MANRTFSHDYSAMCAIGSLASPCANTVDFFDASYVEGSLSPIDAYIENCTQLNLIWVTHPDISAELARVMLLGYVSAVESYFRSVFRLIINSDEKAKADSHTYVITYGAALFHNKPMLAEALLEMYSFSGEKDVRKAFKNFLGIGNVDENINQLLVEFEKICQMRHCCVHRFGKLGTQNGIALGLNHHREVLEKPLNLDKAALLNIASWLMSFIKVMNNYLFKIILDRSIDIRNPYHISWTWAFSKDKAKFIKIYQSFSTRLDATPSPLADEIYRRFKAARGK